MNRLIRALVAVALLLSTATAASIGTSTERVSAAAATLTKGSWGFCTEAITVGCVESVYLTTPAGVTTKYTDTTALSASGAQIAASCTVAGQYASAATSCDPGYAVAGSGNPCPGYQPVFLMFDVIWPTGLGGSATLVAATGSFEPSFTIGSGTSNVQVSQNSDGTYKYAWTTRIEEHHQSGLQPLMSSPSGLSDYRTALLTAVAKSHNYMSHVQVWPRQHLMRSTTDVLLYGEPGSATCVEVPFRGAWAEANAESFSWGFRIGTTDASTAARLTFDARAPHFTYPDANGKSEVYKARIAVFLPRTYLDSIGCADACDLPASSIDVQAQDGQSAAPKVTKLGDGLYVDMGIEHYSAPDPVMTIQRVGAPVNRVLTPKSSLDLPAESPRASAPVTVPAAVKPFTFSRTTAASVAAQAKIAVPKGARVVLTVLSSSAKVCRVTGSTLKALKSGTCRVTVAVSVTKSGKTKTTRKTVSLSATS